MKRSTFSNTNNRNVDTAYVFIEDKFIEIFKESAWLKTNMGSRKIYYDNIASIDYDARGRRHASNSLMINLKSSDNIQIKFVQEEMVNIITNKFETHRENKDAPNTIVVETTNNSNVDDLMKIAELYEKGLLTKEEFEAKKKELL